jgi:hypothetical protein
MAQDSLLTKWGAEMQSPLAHLQGHSARGGAVDGKANLVLEAAVPFGP